MQEKLKCEEDVKAELKKQLQDLDDFYRKYVEEL